MAKIDIEILIKQAKAQAELAKFKTATEKARLSVEKAQLQNKVLETRIKKLGDQAGDSSRKISKLDGAFQSFIGNLGANAVTGAFRFLGQSLRDGVTNAISYENALINVARTANLTGIQQAELAKNVAELTKEIPLTNQELLKFSAIAGQLGVNGVEEITSFTETFAKLSVATNISGEESAIAFTKILGLTDELGQDGAKNIQKLGSVLTQLGNNAKALETDIVSTGLEVAKALAPFGIASENVLAFATTLTEAGVASEAAGSSIQIIFQEMAKAATNGGKELEIFATAAGLTGEEFKTLFDENPQDAFFKLAESISAANLPPGELIGIFEKLGITQQRTQRSLIPLITNFEGLKKNVNLANQEAKDQTALNEEAAKAFKTLGADVTRATEAFNSMVRTLIQQFQPAISLGLELITGFFNAMKESVVLQGLAVSLGVVGVAFTAVAIKAALASTAFSGVAAAASAAWIAVTGPIGLVIAGIGLVAGAVFILIKKWDSLVTTVRGWLGLTTKVKEETKDTKKQLDDLSKSADENAKVNKTLTESLKEQAEAQKASKEQAKIAEAEKKQALKDRADFEKMVRQEELAASQAAQEQSDAEFVQRFQEFTNFNQGRLAQLKEYFTEEEMIAEEARLLNIENERLKQVAITNLITEGRSRELAAKIKFEKEKVNVERDANKVILEDNQQLLDQKLALRRSDVTSFREVSNLITSIAGRESKAAFAVSQAAAFAENIIRTQQEMATIKATFAYAPPLVAALSAKAKVQGIIRGATIAATTVQGFESGGVVPGNNFTGDRVEARVNSGEMIMNKRQQSNLFNMINGGQASNGSGTPITVNTTIELDSEVVGRATSNWVANGGQLGEVQ